MLPSVLLVGPQGSRPDLGAAIKEVGLKGPVALITAGWQERESDDQALIAELGVEAVNLKLHARAEQLFAADSELSKAHVERQTRLKQLHDVYRIRLDHAFESARAISVRQLDAQMLSEERQVSVEVLRYLDLDHLERSRSTHREFEQLYQPARRKEVMRHRDELRRLIEPTTAVVVAGGHVASLLYRLKLFDVLSLTGPRSWVAAAAGAMALTERIYLFHDFAPHGTGVAEVLDEGLGLVKDLVVLPDPRHRLKVDDREGISRFVRRVAPATCTAMDDGARVFVEDGRVTRAKALRLAPEGEGHVGWKT
ncbi:MAG: hypothetical protein IPJ65_12605 [Archangiaceae bacterium]|nr:hypothetical protein [Archangiaceae bacterium]